MINAVSRHVRLLATGLVLSFALCTVTLADVVAVVSANSAVTTLSKHAIADIFLGRTTRFPNGQQAVPVDQEEGTVAHDEFYLTFAGKTPAQVKAHWEKIIFTGRGKPPTAVRNGIEARKLVAANPRAIAYLDRSLVDSSVKALRIE